MKKLIFLIAILIGTLGANAQDKTSTEFAVLGHGHGSRLEMLAGDLPIEVVVFDQISAATPSRICYDRAGKQLACTIDFEKDGMGYLKQDFYKNGELKKLERIDLRSGAPKVTNEELYYETGDIFKAWNPNSNTPQKVETFHQNGKMRSQHTQHPVHGMTGKCVKWHDNGQVMEEQYFIKNKCHGDVRTFDKEGKLKKIVTYKDGVQLGGK